MATKIIYWRIYCETEQEWTYGYLDDTQGTPSTCFTNTEHTVNGSSYQQLSETSLVIPKFRIAEESTETGGSYKMEGFKLECPANQVSSKIVSWDIPVSVLATHFISQTSYEGCVVETIVSPETTIGILTANIDSGVSVLPVSATVIQYATVGCEVLVNSDLIGDLVSVNANDNTITVNANTTTNYTAYSYIKIQFRALKNYELSAFTSKIDLGVTTIGGSYLPSGTLIKILFNNTTGSSITFRFGFEYLY